MRKRDNSSTLMLIKWPNKNYIKKNRKQKNKFEKSECVKKKQSKTDSKTTKCLKAT